MPSIDDSVKLRSSMSNVQSAAAGHVDQNSSAQVVRSRAAICTLISFKWSQLKHSINTYRSRQWYESDVLVHNTSLTWFLKASRSLQTNHSFCYNVVKNILVSPIPNASFDTLIAKFGRLFTTKLVFKFPWDFKFWTILLQNWLKSPFTWKFRLFC